MLQMYAISLFSYLSLSFNSAFALRISELFGIVEILLLPMLYHATRHKTLAVMVICSMAFGTLALALFETKLIQQV